MIFIRVDGDFPIDRNHRKQEAGRAGGVSSPWLGVHSHRAAA